MNRARSIWVLLFLVFAAETWANNVCINPHPVTRRINTSARVNITGSPPGYVTTGINQGMAAWNDPACNRDGRDFPEFTTATPTEANLTLHYNSGIGDACGVTDNNTNTITIYNRRRIGTAVVKCPGHDTSKPIGHRHHLLADTVAHELGHYLGLMEAPSSGCPSFIMSPAVLTSNGWSNARTVTSAECTAADNQSTTRGEICLQTGCNFNGSGDPFHDDPGDGTGGGGGGGGGGRGVLHVSSVPVSRL